MFVLRPEPPSGPEGRLRRASNFFPGSLLAGKRHGLLEWMFELSGHFIDASFKISAVMR